VVIYKLVLAVEFPSVSYVHYLRGVCITQSWCLLVRGVSDSLG